MQKDKNAELIVRFEGSCLGKLSASTKISDLPLLKTSLNSLLTEVYEAEQKGDFKTAIAVLRKAVELYPDDPHVLNGLAWTLVTAKDKNLRNAKEAVPIARKALEKCDSRPDIKLYSLDTLAVALHEDGQLKEAVKIIEQAAEEGGSDYPDIAERAKAYRKELDGK